MSTGIEKAYYMRRFLRRYSMPERNKCPYCTDGRMKYTMKNDPYGRREATCPYCDGTGEETPQYPINPIEDARGWRVRYH